MYYRLTIIALTSILASCSGGGDTGGGVTTNAAVSPSTVSGLVMAPGGVVAFHGQPSFSQFFASSAYAALSGLVAVPDGTIVELARFTKSANVTVIGTTSTAGGRYSFNLSAFGVEPANDVFVRVVGSQGKEMRAFVVGNVADITPVSEAACQLVLESLGGGPLTNFTLQEVSDVTGAVWLISANQDLGNASTLDQAVGSVKSAVGANTSVMSFLSAAAQGGQTARGTSDIGNLFPFEQGNIWRYRGTKLLFGGNKYDTTVLVSDQGPAPISLVNSTVFLETNSLGENRAEKDYFVKNSAGITVQGNDDPGDNISRQLVPFQAVHFPVTQGSRTVLVDRTDLDWGRDEDGDGRNERFHAKLLQTVGTTELVTVPVGTFANSLRMEFTSIFVVTFSTGGQVSLIQTSTDWYVPGVGKVKEVVSVQTGNGPASTVVMEELEGYVVNGQGSGLRIEVNPMHASLRVGENTTLQATGFDLSNDQLTGLPVTWLSMDPSVATIRPDGTITGVGLGTTSITAALGGLRSNGVPVAVSDVKVLQLATNDVVYDGISGKIYVSQPGTQGKITTIDPLTGSIDRSITIGNQPGRLALSDDGQFLYVSIDNENALKRLRVPALTTDLTITLTNLTPVSLPGEYLCGADMKVVPGNSRAVVVAIGRHGFNPGSCLFNSADGAVVYQDGVMLPNALKGNPTIHHLEFSDSPSLVFGLGTYSPGELSRISVTPSGLSLVDSSRLDNWPGHAVMFLNGLIYTASGDVIRSSSYEVIGSFSNIGMYTLWSDRAAKQLYGVTNLGNNESGATVQIFDAVSLGLVESLEISGLGVPPVPQHPRFTSLVRWGSDGLAFRTSTSEVVIMRSPMINR